MTDHVHRYRLTGESVFGLHQVNAVMECQGSVGGKACRDRLTKLLAYTECDQKVTKRGGVTYFWPKGSAA